jgi:hypothetical protein
MRDLIIVVAVFLQVEVTPDGAQGISKLERTRLQGLTVEECVRASKALTDAGPAFNAWCETPEQEAAR